MVSRRIFHAVASDWNGTLIADRSAFYDSLRKAFGQFGIQLPRIDTLRNTYGKLGPDDFVELAAQFYSVDLSWRGDIGPALGQFYDVRRYRLANGARPVIESLRASRIPVAIFSGFPAEELAREIQERELERYLDRYQGGLRSKTRTFKAWVQNGLGINPEHAVSIGDEQSDIHQAKAAGYYTVAYTRGYGGIKSLREAEPDALINGWDEFLKLGRFISPEVCEECKVAAA